MAQDIRALTAEAIKLEREGEFADAIDIYEQLRSQGLASAGHLRQLGGCYLKCRQRQDAKTAWLQAIEMDPGDSQTIALLEQYFRGWEKQAGKPAAARPAASAPPPPPPPPSFTPTASGSLRVETVTPAPQRPAPMPPAAPAPPAAMPTAAAPAPDAIRFDAPVAPAPAAPARQPQMAPVATAGGFTSAPGELGRVNWEYVMNDAAAEAACKN